MLDHLQKFRPYLIITTIALLAAILPLPYAYYQLLKWLVSIGSVCIAYSFHQNKVQNVDMYLFIAIAILFNPIKPIYLTREIWSGIDVIVAGYFGYKASGR